MHPDGIFLQPDLHQSLMNSIQRDCRVLESFKIMDYSLLIGIHNVDLAAREKEMPDEQTSVSAAQGTQATVSDGESSSTGKRLLECSRNSLFCSKVKIVSLLPNLAVTLNLKNLTNFSDHLCFYRHLFCSHDSDVLIRNR